MNQPKLTPGYFIIELVLLVMVMPLVLSMKALDPFCRPLEYFVHAVFPFASAFRGKERSAITLAVQG